MKKNKRQSSINLLLVKLTFTDEPLWYRLLVLIIVLLFLAFAIAHNDLVDAAEAGIRFFSKSSGP